jgi:hypothetical protein
MSLVPAILAPTRTWFGANTTWDIAELLPIPEFNSSPALTVVALVLEISYSMQLLANVVKDSAVPVTVGLSNNFQMKLTYLLDAVAVASIETASTVIRGNSFPDW